MSPIEARLHDALDNMASRDDFVSFVRLLIESHGETPAWDNADVPRFLAGLARAAEDLERYYESELDADRNVRSPSWEAVAGLLFSTRCVDARPQGAAGPSR